MRYVFVQNFQIKEDQKSLVGSLRVLREWEVFRDHFPGFPILPGALILEAMAQHTVVLMLQKKPALEEVVPTLVQIERAKFVEPVIPDCLLTIRVLEEAVMYPNFKYSCEALLGETPVASARLTMSFRKMPAGAGLDFLKFFLGGN